VFPGAKLVNDLWKNFLARAAFTGNQNSKIGWGNLPCYID
jgi:hypothetical protein